MRIYILAPYFFSNKKQIGTYQRADFTNAKIQSYYYE